MSASDDPRTRLHLTVIAKEPIAGRVKTRLTPPLSADEAAAIARACLVDTFDAIALTVAHDEELRPVALIDGAAGEWIPADFDVIDQRGDGLGERLRNGFADLGPGIIIGMDTPSAGPHLAAAVASVRAGRAAMGFTDDGGYWGIGLPRCIGSEFDNVDMSTEHTGQMQLDQLRRIGHSVDVLPTVPDIDRFDDIATVADQLPDSALATVARLL